jgi:hypothetical protein
MKKMNQEKSRVNTYIIEENNDANSRVHSIKTVYCQKCGKVLDEDSLSRFCDSDCRRNYFEEINNNTLALYSNI